MVYCHKRGGVCPERPSSWRLAGVLRDDKDFLQNEPHRKLTAAHINHDKSISCIRPHLRKFSKEHNYSLHFSDH